MQIGWNPRDGRSSLTIGKQEKSKSGASSCPMGWNQLMAIFWTGEKKWGNEKEKKAEPKGETMRTGFVTLNDRWGKVLEGRGRRAGEGPARGRCACVGVCFVCDLVVF